MKAEAMYELPLTPEGVVTIKMSETDAAKLKALLGKTDSEHFVTLYEVLDGLPIKRLKWGRVNGQELRIQLCNRSLEAE